MKQTPNPAEVLYRSSPSTASYLEIQSFKGFCFVLFCFVLFFVVLVFNSQGFLTVATVSVPGSTIIPSESMDLI